MPFDALWGATDTVSIMLPDRLLAYFLLFLYGLAFIYLVYHYRGHLQGLSQQQWLTIAGLSLASFVVSQFLPIRLSFEGQLAPLSVAQNPITTFIPFAAAPFLFAAATLNPAAALIVGACGGLGRALGQTHQLFDIFHVAFAAVLAANWLQQNYIGRLAMWLRHPVLGGAAATISMTPLIGLTTFATADANASYLAAFDLALSTANAHFFPLLIEGAFGGFIIWLILRGLPHLRPSQSLVPSPQQRSLRRRLLSNFVRFAILLIILLVTVVFNLSIRVSTRLVVNQMVHDANVVLTEIPEFQAHLQGLIQQYEASESLLGEDAEDRDTMLRQLYRTNPPFYRRILLVDPSSQTVTTFFPRDVASVQLTDLEQTAVAQVIETSTADIAPAETPNDDYVISLVVPVLNDEGAPEAALVGRVPELSLESLIVGLQGTVGRGTGFVVDENNRIVAHPASGNLLTFWYPPQDPPHLISTDGSANGRAYQGRQEETNARELVYHVTGTTPPWTVVITVPYEVVLSIAFSIGAPLALVLIIFALVFYYNLNNLGRDITEPIGELVQASKAIAVGSSLDAPLPTDRDDELGQLGSAFAHMQRSLKKRLDELSLLLSVSHEVSASIDITHSMPAILQGVLRATGAAGVRAILVNPSDSQPLTFSEGPAATTMASLDRPIMKRLRHTRELMLATPNQIWSTLGLSRSTTLPVPALIAISLYLHERFQGFIWLGYRQPHNFDETERNLLRTLASQASVVVENARLYATAEGGRRRLAAVLASTSDAVIVTDQTERVLLINRAMEKAFNLTAADVIGRPVADVIKIEQLVQALIGDTPPHNLEIPMKDGKIFYTSASTIIRNDGQVLGRVAVLHDITHFKEIDEMKSDFVSTVSHDLRSPLTFMRGYGTMLPMVGDLNEKQQEYIDKILNGIDQMAKLVDDLLDLGRIEAGLDMRKNDIYVKPLLSDIASEYWQHAHFNGINLQVDVPANLPLLKGDEVWIRQAIANLVSNGIKYAPNSGPMMLKAEQANGEVIISVQDNGPGIPQQDQIRLFEKFQRLQQRGTEKVKGSGLGLAIVRSVAERHGGRAWCQSHPGQGSTFSISLPIYIDGS